MIKLLLFIFCTSFAAFQAGAQQQFKIVGYLPYYRFDIADKIDFTKITHLNLAFLNPEDTLGNLSIGGRNPSNVVVMALAANPALKVIVSLGGGAISEQWERAYNKFLSPEHRTEFVSMLTEYVVNNDFDGIDVDLEWQHVNENYSPFVLELRDSIHARGKLITAALPGTHRYADLTQDALDAFDFINLMAYDERGPWNPDNPGPHSDYELAVGSIAFWRGEGVGDERLVLGVPFYGWDFINRNDVRAFTFGSIVAEDTLLAYVDQDGQRYYNGIRTIQKKTLLALEEVSGIMIWEIGQDAFGWGGRYSLLNAIDYVVQHGELPIITDLEEPVITSGIRVFPNPFHENITVSGHENQTYFRVQLRDMQGRVLLEKSGNSSGERITLNVPDIQDGMYIIVVEIEGEVYRRALLRN